MSKVFLAPVCVLIFNYNWQNNFLGFNCYVMLYTQFLITNRDGLRIITINNPAKKNALNKEGYVEFVKALNEAATDDTVNVVAIIGLGDYYSSGNDLNALMQEPDFGAALDLSQVIVRNMIHAFIKFPKLLIAIVNGPCLGITATTVALCDIVYATETVR